MSTDRFVTLREPLRNEQEIKRSRFIACLYPVSTAQQAREHIAELRKEFYDARHRPSAFVLGAGRTEARTSDDGEPAGT
ncbi:YigZ family protein, partial [Propionibacterium freudenreichii]|nr:YigZ family protein [Propionibacterium freudenreichii]